MSKKESSHILLKGSLILWAIWVLINYTIHHPSQYFALTEAPYIGTLLILGIIAGGLSYWYQIQRFKLRGWMIYSVALLFMCIIFHSFAQRGNLYTNSPLSHLFYFIANNILLHLGALGIFSLCFLAGKLLIKPFADVMNIHQQGIVSTAVGMGVITMVLMLLAAVGFLQSLVVIPLSLALIVWQRKSFISFIQYLLWNPIPDKTKSKWTSAVITSLLIIVAFSLVGAIKYFPLGFDGASLYQNSTKLLVDSQHLITGGGAYNWPLFTSIGALLFGSMTYSILLSHIVILLCIWATYHLGRLFLSVDGAWLATTIFFTLPAVGYHGFTDAKVDLGFLFIGFLK